MHLSCGVIPVLHWRTIFSTTRVSLWAALWANDWADGQGDSWALRMPYACLTHTLRIPYANHSPCIGKIEAVLKQKMHLMHCSLASNVAMTGWNYTLQNNISKHIITWRFNIETRNLTQQEYWTHPYASLRNSGFCLRAWMIWPPQD